MTGLAYHLAVAACQRQGLIVGDTEARRVSEQGQNRRELLQHSFRILNQEDAMRAYLANLTPAVRRLLAVSLIALAYPIVTVVLPAIIRAVVPASVQSVLRLM